jgi:bifunctional UDP-N-acetylglucosamine pyrophosphorylase / glucosamine-1-phosphate N-acetyltransferase
MNNLQAIILAAGKSTRFNTKKTKLAAPICGQAMILFPTKLLQTLHIPTTVVIGYQQDIIKNIITKEHGDTINFVTQEEQRGTGHALATTKDIWQEENILVMNGDAPLIDQEMILKLYNEHKKSNCAISFITAYNENKNNPYGKVIRTKNSIEIIEAKDVTDTTQLSHFINAGIYIINKNFLLQHISSLNTNNVNKEFYITDLVKIASNNNLKIGTTEEIFEKVIGVNIMAELWAAEEMMRALLITKWMDNGVRFNIIQSVHLDINVTIGQGSYIGSNVHLRGTTTIGNNCTIAEFSSLDNVILEDNVTIHSHCVIKNSYIQSKAEIGPFAHLRSNVNIGQNSIVGNFVEIKNSSIDMHTKAKHLSYLGDATIGAHVNIGAGTITCNYDGVNKHKTIIENHAFIGSNNNLVAPITIGHNAFTAAGSTLTMNVPDNALAIARTSQTNKDDYAKKLKFQKKSQQHYEEDDPHTFSFIGARVIHPNTPEDEQ